MLLPFIVSNSRLTLNKLASLCVIYQLKFLIPTVKTHNYSIIQLIALNTRANLPVLQQKTKNACVLLNPNIAALLTHLPNSKGAHRYANNNFDKYEANDSYFTTPGVDSFFFDVALRYCEHMFQTKISLTIPRDLKSSMSTDDALRILLLRSRFNFWLRTLSPKHWNLVATVVVCLFKTRDAELLANWIKLRIQTMSLFSHNRFLSLLFFITNAAMRLFGASYGVVGLRVRVAGKISVVGNSRKRSILLKRGLTSFNNLTTEVSQAFYLVRTKTGCLGLTIQLFSQQ